MQLEINIAVHDDSKSPMVVTSLPTVWVGPSALDHVLFDFNPTSDSRVANIKALCAGVIRLMMENQMSSQSAGDSPKVRASNIAITQMEIAQMCAVKAFFAK